MKMVLVPREVANLAENILIRLARSEDALRALGYAYDGVLITECRQAISDAIEACDKTYDPTENPPDGGNEWSRAQ